MKDSIFIIGGLALFLPAVILVWITVYLLIKNILRDYN